MKKKYFISLLIIATGLTMLTGSCKKEVTKGCTNASATNYNPAATADDGSCMVIPFQGPVNPSFENYDGWQFTQGSLTSFSFATGTGFMPTAGYKYMQMSTSTSNNWSYNDGTMFQNNIDISHSDSLIFDYSLQAQNQVALELFFTGNGTDTLWSKTFASGTNTALQKKDFAVALPASLADVGKLTFKISTINPGANSLTMGYGAFGIDNIRMK